MDDVTVADPAPDDLPQPGLGRVVDSRTGRWLLSAFFLCFVLTLIVWNLPDSELRSEVRPVVRPVVNSAAVDQSWSVFAPNPTTVSLAVEADVYLDDGRVIRHEFPHGDDVVGAYREYRWRKWERRVRLDRNDHLWKPTAEWVASRYADQGVERVVLLRHFSDTPEPGEGEDRVWETREFFTLEFVPQGESSES